MPYGDLSPDYDPWEAAAAQLRARYPTREPDPATAAASSMPAGAMWGGLAGGMARLPEQAVQSAGSLQYGGSYDPGPILSAAMLPMGATWGGAPAGAFGAGPVRRPIPGELAPSPLARSILERTQREGGSSTNILTGEPPSSGLMVGMYSNVDPRNLVLPRGQALTAADVEAFLTRNRAALEKEGRYFGTWAPEHGTFLDVSQRFDPEKLRTATKFGERTAQEKGYNVGTGQEFPIGNWYDFIRGPEYQQRLIEMAGRGNEYLRQFPAAEWWDMYGSPFERVYGKENLPYVAGYTASTAPVTAPRPNLQQMSEYMRRQLAGEPIIQPDWRAPEGMMTAKPGGLMPMESSRIANLERTSRGELTALSKAKVREEAAAMTGDPNAVVIDRHQVRLGEAPERGIFAAAEEGTISADPTKKLGGLSDYDVQANVIRDVARQQKRDPRDFSADAWTGIRETIKNTGELYGQKHKGSAITGESKSYADQFEDLLGDKAKHLGITQEALERRLRAGDVNLMSWLMVTTPAVYQAYQLWRAGSGGSAQPSSAKSPRAGGGA